MYQRTQLIDQSIELYNRALELDSHNTEALSGQADNYIRMGFYSKARQYYNQFFTLNPQASARYRASYAYACLKQRDFEKAFINITMAKTEDPSQEAYWLLSAHAYKGLRRMADALADLEIAIWLAPDNAELKAIRTIWLYQQKESAASLQAAREMLKEDPQNELALFMVYMNLKDSKPKEARRALQQIVDLNNDSFAHRVAKKILGK
ncbi:MAG: tetratricopeptide repeat protein [Elusimicrobiaceae bacterium]|nr:tetratricopeptide repeat protein [Elusimicrobiaceae bacterium]